MMELRELTESEREIGGLIITTAYFMSSNGNLPVKRTLAGRT